MTSGSTSSFGALKNVAPDQVAPYLANEHPQVLALILSQLDPEVAAGILANLRPQMQADIGQRISIMENVAPSLVREIGESLEQSLRDIQRLLRELDDKDLATAMKAATEGLKEKPQGLMTEENWGKLTQDMENLGPMWRHDVEAVQLRIMVRKLEEKGEATIVRGFVPDQL